MRNKNNKGKGLLIRKEIFALIMAVIILAVIYFFRSEPTGFATAPTIDISVSEYFGGNITAFTYQNPLEIRDRQFIVSEFTNIGNVPYDAKIDVTVYSFNHSLKQLAYFEDTPILLNPGMRRGFRNEFIAMETGDYYIKLRVSYQYKVMIAWGYFQVYLETESPEGNGTTPEENYTIIYTYTRMPSDILAPGTNLVNAQPNISLEYVNKSVVKKGETILIPVKVVNNGDILLNNIRFYISSSEALFSDVNPKYASFITINDSFPFIITIRPDDNSTTGFFNVTFNVLSDEARGSGTVEVEVTESPISHKYNRQELIDRITSYQYIITELESKIEELYSYGVDVREANSTLSYAKVAVDAALHQWENYEYEKCEQNLNIASKLLESAAMEIGNLSLRMYAAKPEFPYIIVLLIFLAIAVVIIYLYKRKKEAKPSFLIKSESSE